MGRGGAYAVSQTILMHIKIFNITESPVFVFFFFVCVLFVSKSNILDFHFTYLVINFLCKIK